MSFQTIESIVIGLAVVVYIASKQLRWTRIDRSSVWRMPLILGIIGVVMTGSQAAKLTVAPLDIALVGVELAAAVVVGLLMGRVTRYRIAPTPDEKGRRIESRSGALGASLWIALIVFRVLVDVAGGFLGAHLLTLTGIILLTVAVNRAAAAAMIDGRMPKLGYARTA